MRNVTYEVNGKSQSGLVFILSEKGKDNARSLIFNTQDFDWDYLPDEDGLFSAVLGRHYHWGAGGGNLAYSNEDGRVVVLTTIKDGSRKFEELERSLPYISKKQEESRKGFIAKRRWYNN